MMGRQDRDQRQLFYEFSLDEMIPTDHLLRRINGFATAVLADLHGQLKAFYSDIGRPSVDPELMIRMLLVGYCYGLRHERRLCQEVALHLAYRWFCKLDLDDKVPHHSTFSVNRLGRFRESEILRHICQSAFKFCRPNNSDHAALADAQAFAAYLAPLRRAEWVVYAKRPFGGPRAVLAYLSRYTHRVAIANSRLIACDRTGVTFRWKDYRADGRDRQKIMTLATGEFIRRFLIHVLPQGFHRIRHYGLFASGTRAGNIARARRLLDASMAQSKTADATISSEPKPLSHPCPCCGSRMIIIETFRRGTSPRYRPAAPAAVIRIDTS